jgi:hypothetical protein
MILARFPDQFLLEGQSDHLTVRETWSGTGSLSGLLDHD